MKIFIIAYACEPGKGSEPGLGWNISGEVARRHDVTVLTRANNRKIIESYLSNNPNVPQAKIHFLYHDKGGVWRWFKKRIPFGDQLYFSSWLKAAARKYAKEWQGFDIVHQLTFSPFFVKPWGAAYTDRYVWGPIGGGGGVDSRFPKGFKITGIGYRFKEWLYRVLNVAVYSPLAFHFAFLRRKVAAVTFKAKSFSDNFPIGQNQISAIVQETGYAGEFPTRSYVEAKHPLKIVAVGRMIPHKGFEYAIRGFQKFLADGGEGELHICGDGPLRQELELVASSASPLPNTHIIFHGNVPNAEVHAMLDESDVFLHASFIEAAAWSILEAMVHGVPVVCQDRSGMADMITAECGTKVSASSEGSLIEAIASALFGYYANPAWVRSHGEAGQNRVREHYTWARSGDLIYEVYLRVSNRPGRRMK